jgi:hypothetical protein
VALRIEAHVFEAVICPQDTKGPRKSPSEGAPGV